LEEISWLDLPPKLVQLLYDFSGLLKGPHPRTLARHGIGYRLVPGSPCLGYPRSRICRESFHGRPFGSGAGAIRRRA